MGKRIKLSMLLLVVFVAGTLAGCVVSQFLWMRNAGALLYASGLLESAIDAQQLSQSKAGEVLKRKAGALPLLTQNYHSIFLKFMPNDDFRYAPLWQVQRYYEISGDKVPPEIKSILDSLPPRPLTSCELKRLEDVNSPVVQEPK